MGRTSEGVFPSELTYVNKWGRAWADMPTIVYTLESPLKVARRHGELPWEREGLIIKDEEIEGRFSGRRRARS
jgi:hypothetical protein